MKKQLLFVLTAVMLFVMPGLTFGQAPDLGAASSFGVFTGEGAINNTGLTQVSGDIGYGFVGPLNGFPPGVLLNGGVKHEGDAVAISAEADLRQAYADLVNLTCGEVLTGTLGNGQTLVPNVYCKGDATTLAGNLTLDGQGNPGAIFIFQINGAFATSTFSNVFLINGASFDNVYWQINGAFTLGDYSAFRGNILAWGEINLLEGSSLSGRALTVVGAINLHNNLITRFCVGPTPSVISADGPTTFCAGGSVELSGNVDGTWSTGASTPTITVSTSGDYYVTNTNTCGSVTSNHIIVTVNPQPTASIISAGGPTTFCPGGNVILSGNVDGTWSTGALTPTITVTTSGDYYVTNTNACGSVTSNHISVTVLVTCGTIPTLSQWGLIILGIVLLGIGTVYILRS